MPKWALLEGGVRARVRLAVVGLLAAAAATCAPPRSWFERGAEAGFWFEPVSYTSGKLGGSLTVEEIETVAAVAREELATAFRDLNVTVSERRAACYRVRVVQKLNDMRMRRDHWVAGESRAAAGFGGAGAVSFTFIASAAMVFSPDDATRAMMVDAIGRGIGRAAVHEFTHQFLPKAPIHVSRNRESYEYGSANRLEQYYGEMRWDHAHPLLLERFGPRPRELRSSS